MKPDEDVYAALKIKVSGSFARYKAQSQIPAAKAIIGFGETEEIAVGSLLLRLFAASWDIRSEVFGAIDLAMGRSVRSEAPIQFSFEISPRIENGIRVIATLNDGRSADTVVYRDRKKNARRK